jgi:hypothetical protein
MESRSCDLAVATRTTQRTALPPTFIVSVARGPEVSKVLSLTELCGLRVSVESYVGPNGPLQCKRCQRFGHTQRNCGYAPRCVACGGSHLFGGCSTAREQHQCCGCGGNHMANYRVCINPQTASWNQIRPQPSFFSITFLVYLTMTPTFMTLSRQVSSRSA